MRESGAYLSICTVYVLVLVQYIDVWHEIPDTYILRTTLGKVVNPPKRKRFQGYLSMNFSDDYKIHNTSKRNPTTASSVIWYVK